MLTACLLAFGMVATGIPPHVSPWRLEENQILQRSPSHAYYHFQKKLSHPSRAGSVFLHLYLFDTRRCALRVIDQGDVKTSPEFANLQAAMRQYRCLAGCNGGFFDKAFRPMGRVVADRLEISRPAGASSLITGGLWTDGKRPLMRWRDEQALSMRVVHGLEAGPRLVEQFRPISGLSSKKVRRRSFVLTDGGTWWGIGLCRSVSLRDLAEILASRVAIPEINVSRALNLDGGSSSAFWVRGNTGEVDYYRREWGTVRNFIGIVAR